MDTTRSQRATRVFAIAAVVTVAIAGFALQRGFATDTASAGSGPDPAIDTAGATPVEIRDFAFDPGTVTVAAGTPIVWTNADQVPHSVRSESGAFTEQTMEDGATAVVRLTEPGTYAYICGIHPAMTGTIEVTS
jgi:plastocyanin